MSSSASGRAGHSETGWKDEVWGAADLINWSEKNSDQWSSEKDPDQWKSEKNSDQWKSDKNSDQWSWKLQTWNPYMIEYSLMILKEICEHFDISNIDVKAGWWFRWGKTQENWEQKILS